MLDIPLRIAPEPTNVKDMKALRIEVNEKDIDPSCGDKWLHLGYVPAEDVDRVQAAIDTNTLHSVGVEHTRGYFHYDDNSQLDWSFYLYCVITKQGKWGKQNKTYMYTVPQ